MKTILFTFILACNATLCAQSTPTTTALDIPFVFCDHLRGTFQIETNTRLPLSIHIRLCDIITEKRHATEIIRFVYNENITVVVVPQSAIDKKEFITKEIVYVK
jgi:hypothetical protein